MNITNEDNMELMARYEDNYFDLAIVDPPYGIGNFTPQNNAPRQKKVDKAVAVSYTHLTLPTTPDE